MSVRGAAGVAAGGSTATIDGAGVAPSGVVRDGFVSATRGLVASNTRLDGRRQWGDRLRLLRRDRRLLALGGDGD